jgi:hypothetical protein
MPNDTTSLEDAKRGLDLNSRIRGAVMESIKKLMREGISWRTENHNG